MASLRGGDDVTMRRRSFGDEAAIEAATDHLLRQFDPLAEQQAAPEVAAVVALAGGEPAFLVAAADAPDESVAVAHFQCSGRGDEVEMQAANDALAAYEFGDDEFVNAAWHGGRGTIVLSTGSFFFSNPGTVTLSDGVSLVGSGRSTVLVADESTGFGASVPAFILNDRCSIGNFYVDRAGDTPG